MKQSKILNLFSLFVFFAGFTFCRGLTYVFRLINDPTSSWIDVVIESLQFVMCLAFAIQHRRLLMKHETQGEMIASHLNNGENT